MGSCLSTNKTFQGEGRTLNDSSPARTAQSHSNPTASNPGRKLGGSAPPASTATALNTNGGGDSTSDADRETRARAAERRMSQQATKGLPSGQGKLSKQLEQQKHANPHELPDANKDAVQRVVP
uniref:Uncharacterized protein n=1 Tax=Melanopsichium pennsylvanicum 4 TaxID=1398559 RepID=A0A077QZL1_9BASI|nr:putative protein [Melanopsichium pennsylvanicum 4]